MRNDLPATQAPVVELPTEARTVSPLESRSRLAGLAIVVLAGLIRVWAGRYSMNPDGMCYLDLGDALFRHRFAAVNGYWSPLYAWLLGVALFITKPSHWSEFPVAHAVNFIVYLAALACFEFFWRSFAAGLRRAPSQATHPFSVWSLQALGYALFLWTSLDLVPIWSLSPDLCVVAFVYLIAGLLLRMRHKTSPGLYVTLGLVLGLAYLAKAVMFPLGFGFILIGLFVVPRSQRLAYLPVVTFTFLLISAPWLVALSLAKGRFDFGDSGRLNYSALVSPGGRLLNWQGDPPGSGVPVHTTRKMLDHPVVYEFAAPVGGTYPPSYDPSYWNEGRKWTFDLRAQLNTIKECLLLYAGIFLRDQSGLLAGAITLLLLGGAATRKAILETWPLLALSFAPLGLYALVHAEPRFIAGYVTVFWMTVLFGIRLPNSESLRRVADCVALAVVVTILLSVADSTVRELMSGEPHSAFAQVAAADAMEKAGLQAGDRVAVVGDGNWAFWARSAKVQIVTTVTSTDAPAFWSGASNQRRDVYRAFAQAGARAVITSQSAAASQGEGWRRVGETEYYLRWLSE